MSKIIKMMDQMVKEDERNSQKISTNLEIMLLDYKRLLQQNYRDYLMKHPAEKKNSNNFEIISIKTKIDAVNKMLNPKHIPVSNSYKEMRLKQQDKIVALKYKQDKRQLDAFWYDTETKESFEKALESASELVGIALDKNINQKTR